MSPNNYILDGKRVSADEYNKTKYEDLRVRVEKGRKEIIKAHAKSRCESVNAFINRAIDNQINQDNEKAEE